MESSNWPLYCLDDRRPVVSRRFKLSVRGMLDGFIAARDRRTGPDYDALVTTLELGQLHKVLLRSALNYNDLDGLTQLFLRNSRVAAVRDYLRDDGWSSERRDVDGIRGRELACILRALRALGQVVSIREDGHTFTWFGGAQVDQERMTTWLTDTVTELASRDPLGQVAIADVAQRALGEMCVSPARLQIAIPVMLKSLGGRIRAWHDGIPNDIGIEHVVASNESAVWLQAVGFDRLCGYRALSISDR